MLKSWAVLNFAAGWFFFFFFYSRALRLYPTSCFNTSSGTTDRSNISQPLNFFFFFFFRAKQSLSRAKSVLDTGQTSGNCTQEVTGVFFFSPVTTGRRSPVRSSDSKRRRGGRGGGRGYKKTLSVQLQVASADAARCGCEVQNFVSSDIESFFKLHIAILESKYQF